MYSVGAYWPPSPMITPPPTIAAPAITNATAGWRARNATGLGSSLAPPLLDPDAQDGEQHAEPDVVHVARHRREDAHGRERDRVDRVGVDELAAVDEAGDDQHETADQSLRARAREVAPGNARISHAHSGNVA